MRHLGGVPRLTVENIRAATERIAANAPSGTFLIPVNREVADKLAEWCRPKSAKRKSTGIGDSRFVKALDEAARMLATGEWKEATGIHFAALYADLHFRVYGVEAEDLGSKERVYAAKLATDMLADAFGGDRDAMARFVAWTWSREREREKWRRETGNGGGRVTWRAQFGKKLLTEFRLEEARRKAR